MQAWRPGGDRAGSGGTCGESTGWVQVVTWGSVQVGALEGEYVRKGPGWPWGADR